MTPPVFTRPEHHAVLGALHSANAALLATCGCWFGGGTAIVLELGEYRLSRDIDFLCSDQDGYRMIRGRIADEGIAALFGPAVTALRPFRMDQYGIRGVIGYDGVPIRMEIVREARIALTGGPHPTVPVMALSAADRVAEKLLANADRGQDAASAMRDAVDLGMLAACRGDWPNQAIDKALEAYGHDVRRKARWAAAALGAPDRRAQVQAALGMERRWVTLASLNFRRQSHEAWLARLA